MFEKPPWSPKFGGKLNQSPPVLGDLGGRIRLYKQILSNLLKGIPCLPLSSTILMAHTLLT
ncbi:unknown protein (plasmid) [Synechocystis sp. PCC 6803]|uniref:Uncharacterized protein n=1 Tax=Synechocystis sp. (strain ATCC 27184 / PCC 6803 / Kazusa) TaxID=1111708 RepID=Q6ZET5_SYNY3|nr:hypothetical protein MYO_2460 [Synechocystis sp. PCC 6803]AVP91594.1 hypothetical protein C7I86_17680 [Synechocystis sp. IPPAS B-1465]MCW5242408.1 hypothetical protein [Synechocystis sp. PCC 6803]BAD01815.1 unknown protein [Synechocystis sp. PCC 6803]